MPFYPARPKTGFVFASARTATAQYVKDRNAGFICQPKFNGYRACLAVVGTATDKRVIVQNRRGAWLSHPVKNSALFRQLDVGTCLDGEVMPGGNFYPFECLTISGESLIASPTTIRIAAARLVCLELELDWIFSEMSVSAVGRLRANLPLIEGYVRKAQRGYQIGHSSTAETADWFKMKWA